MSASAGKLWVLARQSVNAWIDDRASSMGAAIAFYTMFSLAPLLLISIGIAGLVFGEDAARDAIVEQVGGLVGETGAEGVRSVLDASRDPEGGAIAALVSMITLVVGATTVFAELQSDLDVVWKVPPEKQSSGIWGLVRAQLLSFGMVLGVGFLLIVSLLLNAALAALGKWWGAWFGEWEVTLQAVNFLVSFAVVTGLFAMIYKILPSAKIAWGDVWIGAAVTSLLFSIGKFLIGLYIGRSALASGFGAAGTFVVVIVWVYYSSLVFLLGAEFTHEYAKGAGSKSAGRGSGTNPSRAARSAES
ncbi:MAG: YihY/virulence factor BrkB family protein [Aromatoleum sp.]|jgi:membrane protein|uniref:YihY/virulence factor BrkB family protein n=1 Tax=Aromatoleum sp. TaxID=2307007 RepID=UPI0028956F67|nr:YihY/virulence factor BrkB family protein [Aromatoleum sp.]MDT3670636.1 YihY/virulence factor BrkB family protein [Aromatoleum sp.]